MPRDVRIGSYATNLLGRSRSQRHNAYLAAKRLDGAVIRPGQEFSFNQRVGTFSSDQGYRKAPVSFDGHLIADWGGGVCQTSTTLYNAALLAGMQILERNRHQFCPSYVPPGRDAAVAYRFIDLRFRNPYTFPVRIHAYIADNTVQAELIGPKALPAQPEVVGRVLSEETPATFYFGSRQRSARVRTTGRPGFEVVVYRVTGNRRETVSEDSYPVMNRVVEFPR